MAITRTRLIVVGVLVALAVAGIAIASMPRGGDDEKLSPAGGTAFDASSAGGEDAFDASLNGVRSSASYDSSAGTTGEVPGAPSEGALPQTAPGSDLPSTLDHKIVVSTSVEVGVKEVGRSFQDLTRLATSSGGFVASSSFSLIDDQQVADLTVRVPNAQYQDIMGQLRAMGEVTAESTEANDVTEEYTDLQSRMRTLQATEQRYLELLAQAKDVNEVLTVQDRIDSVRGQIEQVQGRINLLDQLTDLATITVHLRPLDAAVGVSGGSNIHPLDSAANAWERSLDTLRGLAAGVLVVAAFSWWLVPPALVLAFGLRWWTRREAASTRQTAA